MNSAASAVLVQLAGQSPSLIAALVGVILALIFWGRCPRPAACVLAASLLLLIGSVGGALAWGAVLQKRLTDGWTAQQMSETLAALGIAGGLLHAAAIGLLLTAAFLGRAAPRLPVRPPESGPGYEGGPPAAP